MRTQGSNLGDTVARLALRLPPPDATAGSLSTCNGCVVYTKDAGLWNARSALAGQPHLQSRQGGPTRSCPPPTATTCEGETPDLALVRRSCSNSYLCWDAGAVMHLRTLPLSLVSSPPMDFGATVLLVQLRHCLLSTPTYTDNDRRGMSLSSCTLFQTRPVRVVIVFVLITFPTIPSP